MRCQQQPLLADKRVILSMCSNPEPDDSVFDINAERSIVESDAHRPETTDVLEVKRWVPWIGP